MLDRDAGLYGMPGGGMLLLAGDSDGLVDRLGLADDAEHEVGRDGAGDGKAVADVLAVGGPAGAGEGLAGQLAG